MERALGTDRNFTMVLAQYSGTLYLMLPPLFKSFLFEIAMPHLCIISFDPRYSTAVERPRSYALRR